MAAGRLLRDLDEAAYPSAMKSRDSIYGFWKALASFPHILKEDLLVQTNAIALTGPLAIKSDSETLATVSNKQTEARNLTKLFSERFEKEVPPAGLSASPPPAGPAASTPKSAPPKSATPGQEADTNQLITAETRAEILDLAKQAESEQESAATHLQAREWKSSLGAEQASYDLLKKIEELLPKQKQNAQPQEQKNQEQKPEKQPSQPQPQPEQKPKGAAQGVAGEEGDDSAERASDPPESARAGKGP